MWVDTRGLISSVRDDKLAPMTGLYVKDTFIYRPKHASIRGAFCDGYLPEKSFFSDLLTLEVMCKVSDCPIGLIFCKETANIVPDYSWKNREAMLYRSGEIKGYVTLSDLESATVFQTFLFI